MKKTNRKNSRTILSSMEEIISKAKEHSLGEKFYEEAESSLKYVAKVLSGVANHSAFYGVSLVDEPYYYQFDAIGEIYKAVQTVAPGAFCNINLNPMSKDYRALERYNKTMNDKFAKYDTTTESGDDLAKLAASAVKDADMKAAYMDYLEAYYEKVGQYCKYHKKNK